MATKSKSSWNARPVNIWNGFTTRQLKARIAAGCNGGEREEIERREQNKAKQAIADAMDDFNYVGSKHHY